MLKSLAGLISTSDPGQTRRPLHQGRWIAAPGWPAGEQGGHRCGAAKQAPTGTPDPASELRHCPPGTHRGIGSPGPTLSGLTGAVHARAAWCGSATAGLQHKRLQCSQVLPGRRLETLLLQEGCSPWQRPGLQPPRTQPARPQVKRTSPGEVQPGLQRPARRRRDRSRPGSCCCSRRSSTPADAPAAAAPPLRSSPRPRPRPPPPPPCAPRAGPPASAACRRRRRTPLPHPAAPTRPGCRGSPPPLCRLLAAASPGAAAACRVAGPRRSLHLPLLTALARPQPRPPRPSRAAPCPPPRPEAPPPAPPPAAALSARTARAAAAASAPREPGTDLGSAPARTPASSRSSSEPERENGARFTPGSDVGAHLHARQPANGKRLGLVLPLAA